MITDVIHQVELVHTWTIFASRVSNGFRPAILSDWVEVFRQQ